MNQNMKNLKRLFNHLSIHLNLMLLNKVILETKIQNLMVIYTEK